MPLRPPSPRSLTVTLLAAGMSAEHREARQTVPAGDASPGTQKMQRQPCLGGAPGPMVTMETGASHKQKPKSKTPGGAPPQAEQA